ncbi:MAG: anti-sigma factor antagonist [Deltaproteobacteria bacterium]|nr:anti-sigma factor antagonist [Deltaproteobacteria bacterium]
MKVLIAEDEVVSRRLLQSYLQRWGHEVVTAQDGAEAWSLFQAGEFPIVISDWMMPQMDGLELIRHIRACRRAGYVYAILLTSRSHKEDLVEGMESGADDFLTKPFDRDELRVRLRAGQRVIELETALLHSLKDLAQAREREVEIGAKIQQTLLLGQPPQNLPGLRVAALTIPSQHIDGDFYDFFSHHGRLLDVLVGDVMGKGVPAALLGAAIKSQFLHALRHLVVQTRSTRFPEPEEVVRMVHAGVTSQFIGLDFFATLCYARFDPSARRVDFVDCGHTKTIHFRPRTQTCAMLQGENVPLGVSEREVYGQISRPFEAGDVFFFYSDGLTEAQNKVGEYFGTDRLAELIATSAELEPEALLQRVHTAAVEFTHTQTFADDLTCVAVRIESEISVPLTHAELKVSSALSELVRIREFAERCCRVVTPPLTNDDIAQLQLAVTEAASNIARHAYGGQAEQPIELEADAFADRIIVRLYHSGLGFDPEKVPPPAFDGSREGGFGVYIIAKSVDEVRYFKDDRGRNCISLTKYRNCEKEGHSMEMIVEKLGEVTIVRLPGDQLDASNAKDFKREVASMLSGASKVIFDLSQLHFVDSSGLGAMLSCLRQVNASGGDLKLCGLSKPVRALFELVRMHRIFDICNTRDDAIRMLQA